MKKEKKVNKEKRIINKKKIIKLLFLVILSVGLLLGTKTLVFNFLNSKSPLEDKKNRDIVSIGIYEDGTYYISKAKPDIKFAIDSNNPESYKLTDMNNNVVKSKIVKEKDKYYIKPDEKYQQGEMYRLELINAKFTNKSLQKATKLEFKIEEPEKTEYKFAEEVVQLNKNDIQKLDADKIKVKNASLKENQIVLVKDNNTIKNAYKIKSIEGDVATVELPSVSEIYSDIDIYKEGYVNFDDFIFDKNVEEKIANSIKDSSLYSFLAYDVYAKSYSSEPKISIKKDGEKAIIEVELNFKPNGEKKLGIEALKKHELSIKMIYEFSLKFTTDIDLGKIIAVDVAVSNTNAIDIEIKNGDEYLKGIEEISDAEYSKSVQEIVQKIQKEVPDVSENSIDIGAIQVPMGTSGINCYIDVYLQNQLSVLVNFNVGVQSETIQHFGFIISKDDSRAYRNLQDNSFDLYTKVTGKEEIRVGVGLDAGICFINKDLANAGMGVEFGFYQEAFSTFNLQYNSRNNKANRDLVAKLELGLYVKLKVEANMNVLFLKVNFKYDLKDYKYPVLTLGNDEIVEEISSADPVLILDENNRIKIPTINKTLLNLDTERERIEVCDKNSLYFEDSNGKRLKTNNNSIQLEKNEDTKIYAVYENGNGIYKAVVFVFKQGKEIEKVPSNETNNNLVTTNNIACSSIYDSSNAAKAYKSYIVDKKYTADYKHYFSEAKIVNTIIFNVGYCIYDINKDSTPELIINASLDGASKEWLITIIYTYDGGIVKSVKAIHNYSGIRYNLNTTEIVYTELRPTMLLSSYGFYKLVNNNLINTKSISHDGEYYDVYAKKNRYNKYYYSDSNTSLKEITESEQMSYFNDLHYFNYSDISRVN